MLTAFAISWWMCEAAFAYPFTGSINFICLVIFALILDFGIWTLGDS